MSGNLKNISFGRIFNSSSWIQLKNDSDEPLCNHENLCKSTQIQRSFGLQLPSRLECTSVRIPHDVSQRSVRHPLSMLMCGKTARRFCDKIHQRHALTHSLTSCMHANVRTGCAEEGGKAHLRLKGPNKKRSMEIFLGNIRKYLSNELRVSLALL